MLVCTVRLVVEGENILLPSHSRSRSFPGSLADYLLRRGEAWLLVLYTLAGSVREPTQLELLTLAIGVRSLSSPPKILEPWATKERGVPSYLLTAKASASCRTICVR